MGLFPTYLQHEIHFVDGAGAVLVDESGKEYLDFASGIGVVNLGHRHPRVEQALITQAQGIWHTSNLFASPLQQEVANLLCKMSGLGAVFFANSGAEANEAAIKFARRWAKMVKIIQEPEIITFQRSFHGRTLATLTATGQDKVKDGFSPLPGGFRILPYGDIQAVKQATGATTAAVLLELVQGEGGVRPADPAFVQALAAWCREKNILLMIDEVQTGMGRTGHWFAYQKYGIEPDVVTLAKGLGNGFPVGAMLAKATWKDVLGPGSHGTTFGGGRLAMAVARAVLEELSQPSMMAEIRDKGTWLRQLLEKELRGLTSVQEIRGEGLMLGIELNTSAGPVVKSLLEQGLVTLVAGENVLRLLPPLVVTHGQIVRAVSLIKEVVQEWEWTAPVPAD
ncbi:acetylornithine aminotransferase [Thermoactinomyces vulgaris]|jgi:acetylornithine/N-succinyldiaminopimelate aminotransferase|nr:acetylornithine aminotransferase [Thermoactinomyces vulgaris]